MHLLIRTANSGARARTIKLNAIPLTRELATSVPQSQRGGSLLVVHGIPGQRPRSSRRLRNRRTGRHLRTDHMTATLAERPFFLASFQGARFCCSRGDVAPQAVVGHDALPPSPVLGYSNTLFLAPSVPLPEKLSAISLSQSHPRGALQTSLPDELDFPFGRLPTSWEGGSGVSDSTLKEFPERHDHHRIDAVDEHRAQDI